MSDEKQEISPDEAKKALDTIDKMNRAGLQRLEYPRWFAISITLAIFLYIATIQEEGPSRFPLFMVGLLLYAVLREKLGVKPNYSKPFTRTFLGWFFALAVFYLCMVYLRRIYGLIWAPYVGGLIAASFYYINYEVKKRTRNAQRTREEIV